SAWSSRSSSRCRWPERERRLITPTSFSSSNMTASAPWLMSTAAAAAWSPARTTSTSPTRRCATGSASICGSTTRCLLEELHRQAPEGRHRKLRTYANVSLLCIDEVGYLSFDDKSADLLYEIINRRYERKPVILTTNRPFKEWNEVFPNAAC